MEKATTRTKERAQEIKRATHKVVTKVATTTIRIKIKKISAPFAGGLAATVLLLRQKAAPQKW